jgi:hypothetical protein
MENCRATAGFLSEIFMERAGPQRADANVANEGALICLAVSRRAFDAEGRRA